MADHPPNSRLFILYTPTLTEECLRKEFEKFGKIEDCWVVNDKDTRKPKGVCYVKFSKASEACKAMEEMDSTCIGDETRPIKVKMAYPVGINKRESDAECYDRLRCLFVRIPFKNDEDGKPFTEEGIRRVFEQFGNVVNCVITRSKKTCFVTFEKPSEAAKAVEEGDRDFGAVFVDPEKSSVLRKRSGRDRSRSPSPPPERSSRRRPLVDGPPRSMGMPGSFGPPHDGRSGGLLPSPMEFSSPDYPMSNNGYFPPRLVEFRQDSLRDTMITSMFDDYSQPLANNPNRCREIYIKINYALSRENAFRLCNLVPGLEALELIKTVGENAQLHTIFLVRYATTPSAAWAWEKLQDLEYPPGSYIRVRYADTGFPRDWDLTGSLGPAAPAPVPAPSSQSSSSTTGQTELSRNQIVESTPTISAASSILSSLVETLSSAAATSSSSTPSSKTYEFGDVECSVKLSYPKAMLPKTTPYEARLFFLCTKAINMDILEDAFSSFGDLINVYYLSGKNCGYIMYASKRAADAAMTTLNNAILAGSKLKILHADPEPQFKRPST